MLKTLLLLPYISLLFACLPNQENDTAAAKPAAAVEAADTAGLDEIPLADNPPLSNSQIVTIMSFNIQIFGGAKMAQPEVVSMLTGIVSRYDLAAIQEVRSSSPGPVLQFMDSLPEKYAYVLGPRAGRSSSKEQFWIIYDALKFSILGIAAYPDPLDVFERDPLGVFFKTQDCFDFILISNHIRPAGAADEIGALPAVISYFQELWDETDILVVGDLNADGLYYDEALLPSVFPPSAYNVIITNDSDTTLAATSNAYDRFIISSSVFEDYTGNYGILRFDELYDFSRFGIEPKAVSDHYPIWAEFMTGNDTD
jgi:endonuclease/exonuclease/phosphatase family metal-dependent hydrolase